MPRRRRRGSSKARLKKAQLSFYPEVEEYEALRRLSARTNVPQQVYLREGLRYVLQQMDTQAFDVSAGAARPPERSNTQRYMNLAREMSDLTRTTNAAPGRYRTATSEPTAPRARGSSTR